MDIVGQQKIFRAAIRHLLALSLGLDSFPDDTLINLVVTLHTQDGEQVSLPTTATLVNHEIIDNPLVFKFARPTQLCSGSYVKFRVQTSEAAPGYLIKFPYGSINVSSSDTLNVVVNTFCLPYFDQKKSVFW